MKNKLLAVLALTLAGACNSRISTALAQGTAFSYQGRLNDGTNAANGSYDLTFAIYDALANGTRQGPPLTNAATAVSNGLFTATIDFGSQFSGSNRWLQIGVRTNGSGAFIPLAPRQPILPAPYAITAENLAAGATLSGNFSNSVTFSSPGNQFAGDGSGLTNVSASTVGGLAPSNFWQLTGNSGAAGTSNFVGTKDNRPLEFRANNVRGWRLEPTADTPNVIGNPVVNFVSPGMQGATIAGGGSVATYGAAYPNSISAFHGTIGGGLGNTIQAGAIESTVAGGNQNAIQTNATRGTIAGGYLNVIQHDSTESAIGGGSGNHIEPAATDSTVAGGENNTIHTGSGTATIAGGLANVIQANATYAAVGGGEGNSAGSVAATVGGGNGNSAAGSYATVGGGQLDTATGLNATVGGGYDNAASVDYATVGGGYQNFASYYYATVGGGGNNQANGTGSVVAGGNNNVATTSGAAVGGGHDNVASGGSSTVSGGQGNTASADSATVPGGYGNSAIGISSFAAGQHAQANHARSFIWSSYANAASTFGPDTFFVSATNGIGINCGAQRGDGGGQYWLNLGNITGGDVIETSMGAHLTTGGVWSNNSNKNRKTDFVPVSSAEILEKLAALSVQQWRYTNELSGTKHIGPTAQDFKSAFSLGTDEESIGTVDEEGVALAAIQGLNQKVEAKDAEIQNLKRQNDSLARRLAELESAVRSLAQSR